ncbi:MAG: cation diffusion facilitator family transporter [Candidatus Actinomarina sp.]|jgi:cation diffusion facilitator family transporter|nr:cation diffusion facilitator family transporter [Candidatus Actinomarina sp.]NND23385.1 cation diffusion facilitator family transporter [Acidimicrobiia bacterium]|tara:strand:- start:11728 stop:12630 length:903 start_codon:yes stop_codon:yes gene_type:complete
MASSESSKTVFLAMSVNFSIGVAKSIIATITMSSAMFSEAVHSFVDTGNQFLLWFGIKQAKKSNPKIYPLGRGREEYFWTLVVAVLIFTIGGLVSLEHGIESLSHPKKLENLSISLTLLIVSIILESYVLKKAISELKRGKAKNKGILKLLKESTDGPLIAIVVEDFAATLGLIFALVGTVLSFITQNSVYDSISAISIGILLMVSGIFLGYEMKHLITGESISNEKLKKIKQLISSNEQVLNLSNLKILPIGSNQYLALINLDYRDSLKDEEIITVNSSLINSIKNSEPSISEIYFNPQ